MHKNYWMNTKDPRPKHSVYKLYINVSGFPEDGEDPHGGSAARDRHLPPRRSTKRVIPILKLEASPFKVAH